jgi:hypothetical protein
MPNKLIQVDVHFQHAIFYDEDERGVRTYRVYEADGTFVREFLPTQRENRTIPADLATAMQLCKRRSLLAEKDAALEALDAIEA